MEHIECPELLPPSSSSATISDAERVFYNVTFKEKLTVTVWRVFKSE
jgi:hypothetical protein